MPLALHGQKGIRAARILSVITSVGIAANTEGGRSRVEWCRGVFHSECLEDCRRWLNGIVKCDNMYCSCNIIGYLLGVVSKAYVCSP